jgi:cysteine-rich repeat protein
VGTDDCDANAACTNAEGTFLCTCNAGYEGSGTSCTDVDECASTALNECSPLASCTNTVGAYSCVCNTGYEGSGVTCADIDECASGVGRCAVNEVCVNVLGAPFVCDCAPGFARATPESECTSACGNGLRGVGEACDDGNLASGDGCSDVCDVEPGYACYELSSGPSMCSATCGDGLVDTGAGEECDDADANSDTAPDACRTRCVRAFCGDAILDSGEECDAGDANSDTLTGACRTTCKNAFCGDGVIDDGELCDYGTGTALAAEDCTSASRCDAQIDAGVPDAGALDAGSEDASVSLDADLDVDAGRPDGLAIEGNCGCRATGGRRSGYAGIGAALFVIAAVARRRRRR